MNSILYLTILPEIFLTITTMFLLMLGVFNKGNNSYNLVSNFSITGLFITLFFILSGAIPQGSAFGNSLISDNFSIYLKSLIIISTIIILIASNVYLKNIKLLKFEYIILILMSVIGMMIMVSSNDLISLYLGIELQSLPLYVLASIRNKSLKSTESGLKYFVLGALSSYILLYGLSLIYGYTGSIYYEEIFINIEISNIGILIGLAFLLAGFAFKISAVLSYIHSSRNRLTSKSILHRHTSSKIIPLSMSTSSPDTSHPYEPPSWASTVFKNIPQHGRLHLANLPTPLHLVNTKSSRRRRDKDDGILSKLDELNVKLYIKRDDATGGTELGGNKVRKLWSFY